MVVSLEHTCLIYQYLILINTFILFKENAIIWKLVIPFTLSWFTVLLLWYIFRSLSFKIQKILFLSFYAIILRFYPWIYLSLFSFLLFKHLRPFCLESFCLLISFRICFKGSRSTVGKNSVFFFVLNAFILLHAWGIFYFVIILLQILIFSTLMMSHSFLVSTLATENWFLNMNPLKVLW